MTASFGWKKEKKKSYGVALAICLSKCIFANISKLLIPGEDWVYRFRPLGRLGPSRGYTHQSLKSPGSAGYINTVIEERVHSDKIVIVAIPIIFFLDF